uniref:Uncharacterized protein n=1 Tax=Panagrolaimus sp. PS1159 TaxID=55785 RepID=A0AC35GDB5_9BILA
MLLILLFLSFITIFDNCNACQSSIGGTCVSGTAIYGDYRTVNRIETCIDDINRDWCVVVYKEAYNQADFHCFNYYNTNPFLGAKVCGNGPFDINDGGCARLRAPDGSACLVCCCRGGMCNNQYTFEKEISQAFVFTNKTPPSKTFTFAIFLMTFIHQILHFHIQ